MTPPTPPPPQRPIQIGAPSALVSWTRLEPVPRDPTIAEGLQARTADPLWLLARQVAFGEFSGEDHANPVSARVRSRTTNLDGAGAGGASAPPGPLETLIETAPDLDPSATTLDRAHAGLHYLRLLAGATGIGDLSAYRAGLLSDYPFPPPVTGPAVAGQPPPPDPKHPALRLFAGRVPDGAALFGAFVRAGTDVNGPLPATPAVGAADPAIVSQVAHTWCGWYRELYAPRPAFRAWHPDRLEYALDITAQDAAGEPIELSTSEYTSGSLDWLDFDLTRQPTALPSAIVRTPGGGPRPLDTSPPFTALPTRATYRGMPSPRFWAFEDAAVDFGDVTAPIEDPTTSLIVDFAMRYGNDHFIIPFPLEIGAMCTIDSLVVTDTFGEAILIHSAAEIDAGRGPARPFRLFEHASTAPAANGWRPPFVLFPTLDDVINSAPLEEVHYLRDEHADIVWAIEKTAIGPGGLAVDRTAAELSARRPTLPRAIARPAPTPPPQTTYRLRTEIPANWFALLPPETDPVSTLTLTLLAPLDGSPEPVPWGALLGEVNPGGLYNEEVTRAGVHASRAWRYARWTDGRQLSWIGRNARPGRGPGASGLAYDFTTLQPQPSKTLTLTQPPDGATINQATPAFAGRANATSGDTSAITVNVYAGTTATGKPAQTITAAEAPSGWSAHAASTLADGTYTAQAERTNAEGGIDYSAISTFTVDTVAPTVAQSEPVNGSATNRRRPTMAGTAGTAPADSSTVTVLIYAGASASGKPLQTLSAPVSAGAWTVQPTALADGVYVAQATQSDAAGNVGHGTPVTFTIDTAPPAVLLTQPAGGSAVGARPVFEGIAGTEPWDGPTVSVVVRAAGAGPGGTPVTLTTTREPSTGAFSVQAPAELADGQYTAQAEQTDASGNAGSSAQISLRIDHTVPSVVLIDPAPGSVIDTSVGHVGDVFAGTAAPGAGAVTIKVYAGQTTTAPAILTALAPVAGDGHWASRAAPPAAAGLYTAQAEQTAAAGLTVRTAANTFEIHHGDRPPPPPPGPGPRRPPINPAPPPVPIADPIANRPPVASLRAAIDVAVDDAAPVAPVAEQASAIGHPLAPAAAPDARPTSAAGADVTARGDASRGQASAVQNPAVAPTTAVSTGDEPHEVVATAETQVAVPASIEHPRIAASAPAAHSAHDQLAP